MGALTEAEIFDCLTSNLRTAADLAERLAREPKKGPNYLAFRAALRLVEGACKQASVWRQDTRWIAVGDKMAECHRRGGDWLRGVKMASGGRRLLRQGELHPVFVGLASLLRAYAKDVENLRNRKTGRSGMILRQPRAAPHRDTRPVHVSGINVLPSGLIVPSAA
jgi:hypothetical protein